MTQGSMEIKIIKITQKNQSEKFKSQPHPSCVNFILSTHNVTQCVLTLLEVTNKLAKQNLGRISQEG